MKVLHSITCLEIGGAETMLCKLLRQVGEPARDSTVLSLMTPGPRYGLCRSTGASIESLDLARGAFSPTRIGLLRQIHRRVAPELTHGWMYHGNLAAVLAQFGESGRSPIVWGIHHSLDDIGREPRLTRAVIRLCARLSSRVQAITYCSAVSARQHEAIGYDPAKSIVIPNGVDHQIFAPSASAGDYLRSIFGIPRSRLIVGHVGRAHPMKDTSTLLQALAGVIGDGRDVHGLFIGDGHGAGKISEMAAQLGIADRITEAPARDDLAEIVPGLDVFALSSAWGEAFSLSVLEAMASGVPAVVTDIGDSSILVGDTGAVAPAANPKALQPALARLLDLSPDERKRLGMAARARVIGNFSLERYVSRHIELYESLVERPPGRRMN